MKELSDHQYFQVAGGFWPIIGAYAVGSIIGMSNYAYRKHLNNEDISVYGATLAGTVGGLSAGFGNIATAAAGGDVAANIAWRPGFIAMNSALQSILVEKQ